MNEEVQKRLSDLEKRVSELELKKRRLPRKPPDELINPFSDHFDPSWELWKKYKKEQHRFTYKSLISEQAALNNLAEISLGNEITAMQIVKESISNGWQGLFAIKNNQNGQQKQGSSISDDVLKQKLADRFKKQ